jgi:hypothetical protein
MKALVSEEKKYVLHYGGQEYELAGKLEIGEGSPNLASTGALTVALVGDGSLSIVTGPGIPIAVVESPVKKPRSPVRAR